MEREEQANTNLPHQYGLPIEQQCHSSPCSFNYMTQQYSNNQNIQSIANQPMFGPFGGMSGQSYPNPFGQSQASSNSTSFTPAPPAPQGTQFVNPFTRPPMPTPQRHDNEDEEFAPPELMEEDSSDDSGVEEEEANEDYDPLANYEEYMRVRDQL